MSQQNDSILEQIVRGDVLGGVQVFLQQGAGAPGALGINSRMYAPVNAAGEAEIQSSEEAHSALLEEPDEARRANVLYNLGCCLLYQDDVLTAKQRFQEALALQPDNLPAHHNLGYCCELQAEYDEARKAYEAVLAQNPDAILTRLCVAELDKIEGQIERAVANMEALHRANPDNAGVLFHMCRALLSRGTGEDYQRVVALLDGAPVEAHLELRACLAYAQTLLEEHAAAKAHFAVLLESDQDNLFALVGMIRALSNLKDTEALTQYAEHFHSLDPSEKTHQLLEDIRSG